MYIGNVTAGQISSLVWTAATRTLTDNFVNALNVDTADGAPVTSAVIHMFGSYVQLVASLAHSIRWFAITVNNRTAADITKVAFASGPGGSEVDKVVVFAMQPSTTAPETFIIRVAETFFPKGTRVAVRVSNEAQSVADTVFVAFNYGMDND